MHAKLETTLIPITPIERDGEHWLQIRIPNGWSDVKKLCEKVLSYEGRTYTFMSWNSDTYLCHFKATTRVAEVIGKARR